jgi:hypothetical protein
METLSFTATEAGVEVNEYALTAAAGRHDPYQYVSFSRAAEGNEDDSGIHFEFNDQINGDDDCIRECRLSRKHVDVVLTNPIDPRKKIDAVHVDFDVPDEAFANFVAILRRIFRGHESLLSITGDDRIKSQRGGS